jgi:hypothetical protein
MDKFDPQGEDYLKHLEAIGAEDAAGLKKAQASYGNSWKSRGGVGAFMMLARKWDRLENRLADFPGSTTYHDGSAFIHASQSKYDIFAHVECDQRSEGVIDDIRDLRRYLMLVEADLRARGFQASHRDNTQTEQRIHGWPPASTGGGHPAPFGYSGGG